MTPNDIEVLLHCYVVGSQHPRIDAPAVKAAINWMEREGLIYETIEAGAYATTPRGAAHVRQLCNLPLPELAWVDTAGAVIPLR